MPYHRELEATVEGHALVDDVPLDEEVEFRLDLLESESYRAWIAVDTDEDVADEDADADLADVDNERALAFYEKLGFEPRRHRMRVPVDEL